MTSFKKRGIRVDFTLSSGAFSDTNYDSVSFAGLAVSADIKTAPMAFNTATVSIMGLPTQVIERLTVLRATTIPNAHQRNRIKLTLDEDGDRETVIFQGDIMLAIPDFNRAPDVPLMIAASPIYWAQLTVPPGLNFPKAAKVSVIMQRLAKEAGLLFKNNGVPDSAILQDQSLNGNLKVMMETVAQAANVDIYIDERIDTVVISPRGTPMAGIQPIPISRETGLIQYPIPMDNGCMVSCIFDPKYRMFHPAEINVPEIPVVNGRMNIATARHRLDTEIPHGQWVTDMKLNRF